MMKIALIIITLTLFGCNSDKNNKKNDVNTSNPTNPLTNPKPGSTTIPSPEPTKNKNKIVLVNNKSYNVNNNLLECKNANVSINSSKNEKLITINSGSCYLYDIESEVINWENYNKTETNEGEYYNIDNGDIILTRGITEIEANFNNGLETIKIIEGDVKIYKSKQKTSNDGLKIL